MLISIPTQLKVLIYSLIAGMITGILFDVYRVLRGIGNPKGVLMYFEDLLFWIFSAIMIFIFLLYTNNGYFEVYVYFYLALGALFYLKLLSRWVIYIQYQIINFLCKVIRVLKNYIFYPFQLINYYFIVKILGNKKK